MGEHLMAETPTIFGTTHTAPKVREKVAALTGAVKEIRGR
jgi:hypothetical protein